MFDRVLCDHLFLVCRDDIDVDAARLSGDPKHSGLIGILIKDDPKPGTACADARAYFGRMLADAGSKHDGNQVSPGLPYPNTTELAGFMKVNDNAGSQRVAE
jgi:hypothetical protein